MVLSRVTMSITAGGQGQVTVDDIDLSNAVCGVDVHTHVGTATEIVLRLAGSDIITSDYEARVRLTDAVTDALIALGWTPPTGWPTG
jgi:hypothetical protein